MLHEDDELNVNAESAATLISLCAQEGPSLLSPGVVEGVANGGTIHIVTASLPIIPYYEYSPSCHYGKCDSYT